MTSPPAGAADEDELMEFVGDISEYWTYTQVRDWVLMRPDITRTALHLYLLLRSMVTEAARRSGGGLRRMSHDQLCWLLPGVNDKPCSPTMVKDALRVLDAARLVTNPDGERLVTSTGKGGIQNTRRKYQVHDLPPDVYQGWRNVWDKLDAYTPNWREEPPQAPVYTRTPDGIKMTKDGGKADAEEPPPSDHQAASDSPDTVGGLPHPKDGPPAAGPAGPSGPPRERPPKKRASAPPRQRKASDARGAEGSQETAPEVSAAVAMLTALPGRMHEADALDLAPLVVDATTAGWTLPALRAHLSRKCDPERVYNVAAVYRMHLKRLPPPAVAGGDSHRAAPPPPCDICNGSGLEEDPETFLPTGKQCVCRRMPAPAATP